MSGRAGADRLSNLASVVSGDLGSARPGYTREAPSPSPAIDDSHVEEKQYTFPLLQRGGLTDEQLAAIQQSLALPAQVVAGCAPEKHGDVPSFGVEIPNHTLTQVDAIQGLSPEDLQAIVNGQMHIGAAAPRVPEEAVSPYKNWWDEEQEQELVRLVKDEAFRKEVFGCSKIDWRKIAQHFNRTESALRKKIWVLTKRASLQQQRVSGRQRKKRKWTLEQNQEMNRFVIDEQYRIAERVQDEKNGMIVWEALADKFDCDIAAAQRKFRGFQEKLKEGEIQPLSRTLVKKHREHHKKRLAYKWMIVAVMKEMPGQEGTALDIFRGVISHEDFCWQLDDSTAPGTTRVPRWKIQIRKTLSAENMFVNTGRKVKHETVWKLDSAKVEEIKMRPKQRTGQSVII